MKNEIDRLITKLSPKINITPLQNCPFQIFSKFESVSNLLFKGNKVNSNHINFIATIKDIIYN